ncbi:hypothetical protein McpSp1_05740 [Methanocorpusculaceae archaeon Sp1]|nr:hypothetical protein [Methanocorpusculaceae archaeon Sp1]
MNTAELLSEKILTKNFRDVHVCSVMFFLFCVFRFSVGGATINAEQCVLINEFMDKAKKNKKNKKNIFEKNYADFVSAVHERIMPTTKTMIAAMTVACIMTRNTST